MAKNKKPNPSVKGKKPKAPAFPGAAPPFKKKVPKSPGMKAPSSY